jgi:hypothetical protein
VENIETYLTESLLKRLAIILENAPFHVSRLLQDFVDSQRYRLIMIHILKKGKPTDKDGCICRQILNQRRTETCNIMMSG